MLQIETVHSRERRAALRRLLLAEVRTPGFRSGLRKSALLSGVLALLSLAGIFAFLRFSMVIYLAFFLREENILSRWIGDGADRDLVLALNRSSHIAGPNRDLAGARVCAARADSQRPTAYGAFLRADLFAAGPAREWNDLAPEDLERLAGFRKAMADGARIEPGNILWPLLDAEALILEGKGAEGLERILQAIPRAMEFRLPMPEGPYQDIVGLAELFASPRDLPYHPLLGLRLLAAQAAWEAEGSPARAREFSRFLDRLANLLLERLPEARNPMRVEQCLRIIHAAFRQQVLLCALPRHGFSPEERDLAVTKAGLARSIHVEYATARSPIVFAILIIQLWLLLGVSALPALMVVFDGAFRLLGIGKPRAMGLFSIRRELKCAPLSILGGACLAGWVLLVIASDPLLIEGRPVLGLGLLAAFAGLAITAFWGSSRPARLRRWAGKGPWDLKVRSSRWSIPSIITIGLLFLSAAAIFLIVAIPLSGIAEMRAPGAFLLHPERSTAAIISHLGRIALEKNSSAIGALRSGDAAQITAAARKAGVGAAAAVPQEEIEGLLRDVEALQQKDRGEPILPPPGGEDPGK